MVLDKGWSAVRMGAIASAVGISRQSLHAEFGTKDDLGHALVTCETTEFAVVAARLAEHPGGLPGAVFAAAHYMLTAARENPLLQTILTRAAGSDGDVSLLSVLTIQGEPIIGSAAGLVGDCPAAVAGGGSR